MVRIGLDLAADARDAHVDGAVEGVRVAGVGEVEQALARQTRFGLSAKAFRRLNSDVVSGCSTPSSSRSTRASRSSHLVPKRTS